MSSESYLFGVGGFLLGTLRCYQVIATLLAGCAIKSTVWIIGVVQIRPFSLITPCFQTLNNKII